MPSERPTTTRILLISETAIYREGLRLLLDAQPGLRVVGAAADCAQAVKVARDRRPDILLLDLPTPILPNPGALEALARVCAAARIIVIAPALDKVEILEALRHGVRGVLLKVAPSDLLFRSIRAVAAGQYWIGRETVADLVRSLSSMPASTAPAPARKQFGLTTRELEVVAALVAGCGNKEIAKRFAISEKTVKHHLTNTFDKLGLSNRLELAIFALHHGLIVAGGTDAPVSVAHRPRPTRSSRASRRQTFVRSMTDLGPKAAPRPSEHSQKPARSPRLAFRVRAGEAADAPSDRRGR